MKYLLAFLLGLALLLAPYPSTSIQVAPDALVVIGHCWPLFAGFRGGMGLASTGGGLLGLPQSPSSSPSASWSP